MSFHVGFGYDIHRLEEGRKLWIGGVCIEHSKGAVGHSDADVLIHAICDALLGAANLRDIGFHFPDTDPAYKGIDSKKLLKQVNDLIKQEGFVIVNIDTTVILQQPKLSGYIEEMKKELTQILLIKNISIKAKTNEGLDAVGRQEAVVAYAVALLEKSN